MAQKTTIGSLVICTLKDAVERLQQVYDLSESYDGALFTLRHDGIHAMTGFDISLADEMRVAVVERGLAGSPSFKELQDREERLYYSVMLNLEHGLKGGNVVPNGLETERFHVAQGDTVLLDDAEVKEYGALALCINEAVRRMTGKYYYQLSFEELAGLDFHGVDFVAEAHAIKDKYQKPQNRAVEERTADIFNAAARAKGRGEDLMPPPAGASWNTAARATVPQSLTV